MRLRAAKLVALLNEFDEPLHRDPPAHRLRAALNMHSTTHAIQVLRHIAMEWKAARLGSMDLSNRRRGRKLSRRRQTGTVCSTALTPWGSAQKLTANRSSARVACGLVEQMTCPTPRPPWPAQGPLGRLREGRQGPAEARTVATRGIVRHAH
jgi:hypothetical protein